MVVRVDEAAEVVVQAYGRYRRVERRLAELTVSRDCYGVRRFLAWRSETGCTGLDALAPEELVDYVLHEAQRLTVGAMRPMTSTLRTFARFLFATGVTARDLSGSVPSVAGSRFDGLPTSCRPCWPAAIAAGRSVGGTWPSWSSCPVSGCGRPRSPPCTSRTSTGGPENSR